MEEEPIDNETVLSNAAAENDAMTLALLVIRNDIEAMTAEFEKALVHFQDEPGDHTRDTVRMRLTLRRLAEKREQALAVQKGLRDIKGKIAEIR